VPKADEGPPSWQERDGFYLSVASLRDVSTLGMTALVHDALLRRAEPAVSEAEGPAQDDRKPTLNALLRQIAVPRETMLR
jgi:hypothetical protein